jgi:hypothetical protein
MHGRTPAVVAASGAALALFAVPAWGQGNSPKPKDASVTLDAKPTVVVFGSSTTLSGDLKGDGSVSGVDVRLERDEVFPFGDAYAAFTTVKTATSGRYSVGVTPPVNTQYRASVQSSPPVQSAAKLVLVRMRVGVRVSTTMPRRGTLVRFRGSVLPAHDGTRVIVQRRSSTGRWVAVRRTSLTDAGTARSAYSARVRVSSDGTYRVKAVGHADHINGLSRTVALDAR